MTLLTRAKSFPQRDCRASYYLHPLVRVFKSYGTTPHPPGKRKTTGSILLPSHISHTEISARGGYRATHFTKLSQAPGMTPRTFASPRFQVRGFLRAEVRNQASNDKILLSVRLGRSSPHQPFRRGSSTGIVGAVEPKGKWEYSRRLEQ